MRKRLGASNAPLTPS